MMNEVKIMMTEIDNTFLSEKSFGVVVDATLLELAAACVRRSIISCGAFGRCEGGEKCDRLGPVE
jgi:hypothetical protein